MKKPHLTSFTATALVICTPVAFANTQGDHEYKVNSKEAIHQDAKAQLNKNQFQLKSTDELVGADIKSIDGEEIGEVSDLIINLNEARVTHLLIESGGVFDIGDDLRVVSADRLTWRDGDFVLDMTEDEFENLEKLPDDVRDSLDSRNAASMLVSYTEKAADKVEREMKELGRATERTAEDLADREEWETDNSYANREVQQNDDFNSAEREYAASNRGSEIASNDMRRDRHEESVTNRNASTNAKTESQWEEDEIPSVNDRRRDGEAAVASTTTVGEKSDRQKMIKDSSQRSSQMAQNKRSNNRDAILFTQAKDYEIRLADSARSPGEVGEVLINVASKDKTAYVTLENASHELFGDEIDEKTVVIPLKQYQRLDANTIHLNVSEQKLASQSQDRKEVESIDEIDSDTEIVYIVSTD